MATGLGEVEPPRWLGNMTSIVLSMEAMYTVATLGGRTILAFALGAILGTVVYLAAFEIMVARRTRVSRR